MLKAFSRISRSVRDFIMRPRRGVQRMQRVERQLEFDFTRPVTRRISQHRR